MRRWLQHITLSLVLAIYLAPLAVAVWVSFSDSAILELPRSYSLRWYADFFSSTRWRGALGESLLVAASSAVAATLAAFGLAFAVVRQRSRLAARVASFAMLPLFIPPVVLGIALLPVARWTDLSGSSAALIFAHTLEALPVAWLILRDALEELDDALILAARGLGASPGQTFRHVILPLIAPGLAAAVTIAFVLSINEFVLALFLTTSETETLPRVIWPNLRYTLTPLVAAASGVSTLFAVIAVLAIQRGVKLISTHKEP